MLARRLRPFIEDRLRQMPGVVLLGPRQVGKTTLARQIVKQRKARAIYLDLERPLDQRRLGDADAFLRAQTGKLVVIDEIHRARQSHRTVQMRVLDDVEGLCNRLSARADLHDIIRKGEEVEFRHEGDQQFEADLLRELVTGGCRVVAFGSRAESLEDVFMRVTEGLVQ